MNDTLYKYLNIFCICYIDDILIYSCTLKEHKEQVRQVLYKLKEAGLFVKLKKWEFSITKTSFLSFIISKEG